MNSSTTSVPIEPVGPVVSTRKAKLVFIIGALSAFGPLSLDMYLPGLPSLATDLGGTASQVQLTLTACLLGLAGGQVVAGPLSDALGRRRPLLVGLVTYMLASLFCALAPVLPVLIGLRFVQGAAGAAGIVIARAVVRDLYSGHDVARFFALTMIVNGLAPILAPVIGGQLLQITNWRGVFFVLTVIGLGLVLLAFFGLRETLPAERRRSGGIGATLHTFRHLLTDRVFMGYALSSGLAFSAMFAYIAGSPFVLQKIYGVSPQVFSLMFGANAVGIVVMGQISGRLVGKVPPRRLMGIGLATALTGGLLLLLAVLTNIGLVGILPSLFLLVSSVGFIAPNATALALADHAQTAGSASAFLGVSQYIIGAAVTPLVGIAGEETALPMALIIALATSGAALLFVLMTRSSAASNRRAAIIEG